MSRRRANGRRELVILSALLGWRPVGWPCTNIHSQVGTWIFTKEKPSEQSHSLTRPLLQEGILLCPSRKHLKREVNSR